MTATCALLLSFGEIALKFRLTCQLFFRRTHESTHSHIRTSLFPQHKSSPDSAWNSNLNCCSLTILFAPIKRPSLTQVTWRWLIVYSFERESWKIFSVSGKARIYVVGLENYLSNLTSCDCRSQNNSLGTYRFANLAIMEIESTSGLTSDEVHSTPGCWLRRRGKTCIADADLWILSCKQTEIEKGSEIMSCSRKFPCFLVQCLRWREISFNRRLRSLIWRLNYRLLQPSRSSRSQTTK